ncbi:SNF2 family N-terminal domain-containing protein [Irpex rosettiformis]|uniref:SNF2 family N-terminal domain-containing protein n=1 Tax=Irpex rosettiformis TaxID=378272 RepID=A0ACB8U5J1_9APHY|nr:SNF2 family N-terminal domain-containing protein [Irpex rosettiformis]
MDHTKQPGWLAELAKKQLNYPSVVKDKTTLAAYTMELQNHVDQCPNDTNFSIKLEPKKGFGVVTCLESGCRKERIDLVRRMGLADGGKSIGLGSLSRYRAHIECSPMHVESRNARIAIHGSGGPDTRSRTPVKAPATPERKVHEFWVAALVVWLLNIAVQSLSLSPEKRQRIAESLASSPYKSKPSSSQPTHVVSARTPRPPVSAPAPSHVFQAPSASAGSSRPPGTRGRLSLPAAPFEPLCLPPGPIRKRRSSVTLNALNSEAKRDTTPSGLTLPPTKMVRVANPPSNPGVAPPSNTNDTLPASSSNVKIEDTIDTEAIRDELNRVEYGLREVEQYLHKVEDRETKTKADMTRMMNLTRTREDLQANSNRLNGMLEVEATRTRTSMSMAHPSVVSGSNVQLSAFNVEQEYSALGNIAHGLPQLQHQPQSEPLASGSNEQLVVSRSTLARTLDGDAYHVGTHAPHGVSPLAHARHRLPVSPEPTAQGDVWSDELPPNLRNRAQLPIGLRANQHDINQFLLAAGNAESFDQSSSVTDSLRKLGLRDIFQPLSGMKVALMPHQAIGVSWMLEKELDRKRRGGLLADEMGLGKTVQIIALMAKNRPPVQAVEKSTLIVAPLGLLQQWHREIMEKTDMGLRVLIYHGTNRPKTPEVLRRYDVVLTTYQTLLNDWPYYIYQRRKKEASSRRASSVGSFIVDDESGEEEPKKKQSRTPLLYKINDAHTSEAVAALDAQYRWCLTGTPIINTLEDTFPYFRFLKIRPWNDWHTFKTELLRSGSKKDPRGAMGRLQVVFKTTLLRRLKDSKLNGEPLVTLPLKIVELIKLEFSREERDVYDMVETRSQRIFNRFLKNGTVLKNYLSVLALLFRLRQICSHPALITQDGYAFIRRGEEADDSDRNAQLMKVERVAGQQFVRKMKFKCREAAQARIAAKQQLADGNDAPASEDDNVVCSICLDNYEDPVVTTCCHVFCRNCIVKVIESFQPTEGDDTSRPRCPVCRADNIKENTLFPRAIFEPTQAELRDEDESKFHLEVWEKVFGHLPRKALPVFRRMPSSSQSEEEEEGEEEEGEESEEGEDSDQEMRDFIVEDDESETEKDAQREARRRLVRKPKGKRAVRRIIQDSDDEDGGGIIHGAKPHLEDNFTPEQIAMFPEFLPSTKMKQMMEALRKIAQEAPREKVLVISQWTQCLDLVSNYLTENGILHVKYQGDMTIRKRTQAVQEFMSRDKATVMLMSQKCGGVGLNLTRANHVISLDLAWSNAIEQQAYDRVHRLGQTRSVHVRRFVIARTIEDRILKLQENKQILADGSLGEGAGIDLRRLSIKDLASLFNLNMDGTVMSG